MPRVVNEGIERRRGNEFLNQLEGAGVTGDALQRVLDDAARRTALFNFFITDGSGSTLGVLTADKSGSMGSMETAFKFTCWNCKKEIAEDFINADIGHRIIKKCSECGKDNVVSLIFADLLFKRCLAGKPREDPIIGSYICFNCKKLSTSVKPRPFHNGGSYVACAHCGETNALRPYDFESLFDLQIAILKSRGCPEQIVETLQSWKPIVLVKAMGMTIGEGNVPFLPVITPACLGYYGLMDMVRNGLARGSIYYIQHLAEITDVSVEDLYYIYDVEDGSATLQKSLDMAKIATRGPRQYRFMLSVAEGIALTTHTDVLSRHDVLTAGSHYGAVNCENVPNITLKEGSRPFLVPNYIFDSDGHRWGFPSCGSRGQ